MRVVVRESMSMDLLARLVNDICLVTENIIQSDQIDLSAWQPFTATVEKQLSSAGLQSKDRHRAKKPMSAGIHRSVC